ncbi:MAG: sulfatase [Opitutaceae bacterium]|jgi:arylsulfatase A-like enzyme|nr:sulfatase [Opitutaceae bacterium]
MDKSYLLLPVLPCLPLYTVAEDGPALPTASPNIIVVSFDDMNNWASVLGVRPGVITPNMERLAARGMVFTNAHCPSPVCNPSRTAIMTGLRAATSGVYSNAHWWRPAQPDVVTLPGWFRKHGYWTEGAGKVFHHTPGFNDPGAWDNYYHWSPASLANGWQCGYNEPPDPRPEKEGWPEFVTVHEFDAAPLDVPDEKMPDRMVADHAAAFLAQKHEKPFFMHVGTFRPHIPLYVPKKYFDLYPADSVALPPCKADDLDDISKTALKLTTNQRTDVHDLVLKTGRWRDAVRAYLASITFADAQLGVVLDALDKSNYAGNTIVVAWSDHGWHLGEKHRWGKWSLWRCSTQVPLLVYAPGLTRPGARCARPVNLVDLYPTLAELAGLPPAPHAEGRSLVPLLCDPAAEWPWPSLTTFMQGNHSLFGERWHYIRYADGTGELYDIESDPDEWNNLAGRPELDGIRKEMARHLPKTDAAPVPSKSAYKFDPAACTWEKSPPKKTKTRKPE